MDPILYSIFCNSLNKLLAYISTLNITTNSNSGANWTASTYLVHGLHRRKSISYTLFVFFSIILHSASVLPSHQNGKLFFTVLAVSWSWWMTSSLFIFIFCIRDHLHRIAVVSVLTSSSHCSCQDCPLTVTQLLRLWRPLATLGQGNGSQRNVTWFLVATRKSLQWRSEKLLHLTWATFD